MQNKLILIVLLLVLSGCATSEQSVVKKRTHWKSVEVEYGSITQSKIFGVSDLDVLPEPLHTVAPVPPLGLIYKDEGTGGEVLVEFTVSIKGKVENARVLASSHSSFSIKTLTAIKQWKFKPGTKDDAPIAVRVQMSFTFTVNRR